MDNINFNEIILSNIKNINKILLNIIDESFDDKIKIINGKILSINDNQIIISTNRQTIVAKNSSDLNFKEGQDILLKLVDIKDGKYIYKVINYQFTKNSSENNNNITINNNLIKIEIPKTYFNDNILTEIDHNDYLETFVKNNNTTISIFFDDNFVEQIKYKLPFDYQGPALLKYDDEFVRIIISNNENQQKIINLFKNVNVEIKNNIDMYTAYGLVIDKKPITKEDFINEKIKFSQYIKNFSLDTIQEKSLLPLLIKVKSNNQIKNLSDAFLLYKLKDIKINEFFIKDEKIILSEDNPKEAFMFTKDNYNYYILNNQSIINNYNGNVTILIKENNRKKGLEKIDSVAVIVNTDNLGRVSFCIKKINNEYYNIVFILENLDIYNYFKSNKNILVESLKLNNKKIKIEYRISKNNISNIVLEMMIDNNELSKIDLKV